MPIIEQTYQILFNDKNPMQAIYDLMIREKKSEHMQ
jgi:glycerol-3-phosphate dehydrogenase